MFHESASTSSEVSGGVNSKKKVIKNGNPLSAVWRVFEEYSDSSTIHGVKYLGEGHRHWIERLFWFIAFLTSFLGCSIIIYKIYEKWQQTPVIVSFSEKSTPIWDIPFPAITICPETKVKSEILNITNAFKLIQNNELEELTADELMRLEAIVQTCQLHLFSKVSLNSGLKREDIISMLKSTSLSLDEIILTCQWRNSIKLCSELFSEVLTEEGFCYTFNSFDASDIFRQENLSPDFNFPDHNISSKSFTLEKGYSTDEVETYPQRVTGTGIRAGLNVVLRLNESDFDYLCRGPIQGFKVYLHTPGEIPMIQKHFLRVPLRQEVVISVKPNMILTSDNLVDYAPDDRQCFFEKERYLRFFKSYTQSNCETECLANFTLTSCGCVKFSMPRLNSTKICSQSEISCYDKAEDHLMLKELKTSLQSGSDKKKRGKNFCNCLPSCTSLVYDAETSQSDFEFSKVLSAFGIDPDEFSGESMSRLTIFFKESQFTTSQRSELYGFTDFLANCGGLLGLFMGVSVLSLVEIFYHVTLRLACNLRKKKNLGTKASRKSYTDVGQMADFEKNRDDLLDEVKRLN